MTDLKRANDSLLCCHAHGETSPRSYTRYEQTRGHTGLMLDDLVFSLPCATNRRDSGVGQTLQEQQAFHRAHSYPGSVHICGVGNTQKDKFPTAPEFFFWQPTTGHIARFQVTEEPRDTNTRQAQTNIAHGFTIKPEQVFLKWTTSGRRPLEARNQGTPGNPPLPGLRDSSCWGLCLGQRRASFSRQQGRDVQVTSEDGRVREGKGAQFLRTPAEVDYARPAVQRTGKAVSLGLAGQLSSHPLSHQIRRPMRMNVRRRRNTNVVSRVSSHWNPFLAWSSCCLRRASRRARRRRSRSSCSP